MADGAVPWVRVSVILAVRDAGPGLADTVERLTHTVGPEDEVVAVDDASRDGTADLLQRWAHADQRVRVVVLPRHQGVATARNTALRLARGEAVWFVDWDDIWRADILERLHAAWSRNGRTIVVCGAEHVDDRGVRLRRLGPAVRRTQVLTGPDVGLAVLDGRIEGYLWNKMFARSVLPDEPFPPVPTQSDFAGSAPLIARQPLVTLIPDMLYAHVRRPGSLTNTGYPSMEPFDRSLRVVESIATELRAVADGRVSRQVVDRALLGFRYRELHLTGANSALRLSHEDRYRHRMLAAALAGMRWGDLARLAPRDPVLAGRSAVLLATRHRYPMVYDCFVAARDALQRRRRPRRHRQRSGRLSW